MLKIVVTITEENGNKIQKTFDDWKTAEWQIKFALEWFAKEKNAKIEIQPLTTKTK